MAFTNQFAMTVELTRLFPSIKWAADKAGDVIMSRARELRHSGSDIVVEEDLANIFGRCRISPALTSSFKTIITKSTSNVSLLEGIVLQGGPGPTVIRALQEPQYFAMVIQLSLLVWAFERGNLANTIADALRKRLADAPSSSGLPNSPDRNGIKGVLGVCETQTTDFNWNMLIDAVSITLGYEPGQAPIDFPAFVFQGLIDMFPMVQRFPEDRMIHIQIPVGYQSSSISVLVVWAHHVLNLEVLVRPRGHEGLPTQLIRFGDSGHEQVLIEEVIPEDGASITLLDAHGEHLLTIKPGPDEDPLERGLIGSIRKLAARGWGNALLRDVCRDFAGSNNPSEALIEELQMVVSAFAFIVAKNLVKEVPGTGTEDLTVYDVDERQLLQAGHFLFDNPQMKHGQIDAYVKEYTFQALDRSLPKPPAFKAATRDLPPWAAEAQWERICRRARCLGIFMLALAHILNLEECENLMFAGFAFESLSNHPLAKILSKWKGRAALPISDDAWLRAIAVPLIGHRQAVEDLPWEKISLISDRGWSAWLPSLADMDPGYVSVGSMMLGRGSPCRNGIWKRGIWDFSYGSFLNMGRIQTVESCGQSTILRCAVKVTQEIPYCGEADEVFLVSARFRYHQMQRSLYIGYKTLHKNLWWAQVSKACRHGGRSPDEVKLGVGCATFAGVAGFIELIRDTDERILICLTAHSVGARWHALVSLPITAAYLHDPPPKWRHILLRRNDCCYQCVIDEAALQAGNWFIIL